MPIAERRIFSTLLSVLWLGAASIASAQARSAPDAADIALAWARGAFASPIVCRFAEGPKRGLRRVLVTPGPKTSEQRVDRVQFVDLAAKGAERCSDELGADEPNIVGTLYITHTPRRPRSDTPQRDFEHEVERGPIRFVVVHGRLGIASAALEQGALRDVDFEGGTLELAPIRPGTDDARRIADLTGVRQLRLEAKAKDGTRIAVALVEGASH